VVGLLGTSPPAYIALSELGRGLGRALGMCPQVKVDLDGVNTSDAVLLRYPMEDTLVFGYDEPYIGASCLLPEGESFEKRNRRLFAQVSCHEAKAGKTGDEPGGSEPRRRIVHFVFAESLGQRTEESVTGSGGNVTSQNAMLLEVVLLPPRIEQQARIARSNGSGVVANHEVLVLESADHSAGVAFVYVSR
jgi:hypothetical protein